MKQLQLLCYFVLAVITVAFASCATQPQASTTHSPMERQNGNGLASAMH